MGNTTGQLNREQTAMFADASADSPRTAASKFRKAIHTLRNDRIIPPGAAEEEEFHHGLDAFLPARLSAEQRHENMLKVAAATLLVDTLLTAPPTRVQELLQLLQATDSSNLFSEMLHSDTLALSLQGVRCFGGLGAASEEARSPYEFEECEGDLDFLLRD